MIGRQTGMQRPAAGRRGLAAALFALVFAGAGCGLIAGDKPAPPPVCEPSDPARRDLTGVMVRQPEGAMALELLPVEGRATRRGAVRRLESDDRTLRVRSRAEDGGFAGWWGERGAPIPGLADGEAVSARQITYRKDGIRFSARAVYGRPSQGTRLPSSGMARYEGPVRIEVTGGSGTSVLTGTVVMSVRFGSGRATASFVGLTATQGPAGAPPATTGANPALAEVAGMAGAVAAERLGAAQDALGEAVGDALGDSLGETPLAEVAQAGVTAARSQGVAAAQEAMSGLMPPAATLAAPATPGPLAALEWRDLGICAARIGSTGQGSFQASDAAGRRIVLAGTALFEAMLYGTDETGGAPSEIGGVLVIQTDEAAISGAFVAGRAG
jgi:hypothetical protein